MAAKPDYQRSTVADESGHAVRSHAGGRRAGNEDRWLAANGIYAVADGVAGAPAGEIAATLAIAELAGAGAPAGEDELAALVQRANRVIHDAGDHDPELAGMATTLTVATVHHDRVALAHVGDSRAYRLRDGLLERLTEDHSFGAELVQRGVLDPDAAAASPFGAALTRALGEFPEVAVDTSAHVARPGDIYLLCTDGLTAAVSDEQVARILRASHSLGLMADRLVESALRAGGPDNVTVVLFGTAGGQPRRWLSLRT